MPTYTAPLRDIRFVLHEVLDLTGRSAGLGLTDVTADVVDAILEEAGKFSTEMLQPLNATGDRAGCHLENGVVRTPDGFQDAYKKFAEGGWVGLAGDPAFGGQGLPRVLAVAVNEMMVSANMAFMMFPGLLQGAAEALHLHGTDDQKATYLPKLLAGAWAGTMNLTEPQAGTDLGLIKTKAEPQANGSYKITGTKIFISAGEHDLTENIVHLVLARIAGAPEGVQGISLFVVPKFLVNADGSIGARNGVTCVGLEHKMGIHASPTCVMSYEDATGYLVGEAHKGLRAMFTMMNAARLGVALQGYALAEVATQNAAVYARERLQGRALTGPKAPDKAADPLIVHPDVRRMLMDNRVLNEGGRALLFWTVMQADVAQHAEDAAEREAADDLVGLLTPALKAYLTDKGFQACVEAQQIYGGHGYIAENGMEQFVRDARIPMIYEGANGIQALDLVGRKLAANNARALLAFFARIDERLAKMKGVAELAPWHDGLAAARADLEAATQWLMKNGLTSPDNAGAVATDYLEIFALTAFAYMWTELVGVAQEKLRAGGGDKAFYENKIATGRYFLARILPDTASRLAKLRAGADPLFVIDADAF